MKFDIYYEQNEEVLGVLCDKLAEKIAEWFRTAGISVDVKTFKLGRKFTRRRYVRALDENGEPSRDHLVRVYSTNEGFIHVCFEWEHPVLQQTADSRIQIISRIADLFFERIDAEKFSVFDMTRYLVKDISKLYDVFKDDLNVAQSVF